MYIHIYLYIYMYINIYIDMYIQICIYVYIYICMCIYIYMYVYILGAPLVLMVGFCSWIVKRVIILGFSVSSVTKSSFVTSLYIP